MDGHVAQGRKKPSVVTEIQRALMTTAQFILSWLTQQDLNVWPESDCRQMERILETCIKKCNSSNVLWFKVYKNKVKPAVTEPRF